VSLRGKVRPVIVLSTGGDEVRKEHRTGAARWQSSPTLLVAPFYGADQDGSRGGWRPEFVQRIRRCEYPQYIWDRLPLSNVSESILRLDHIQPIGHHENSFDWTPHCLSDEALRIVDEWLYWLGTGTMLENFILPGIRAELLKL
jgi:hypothetical protein